MPGLSPKVQLPFYENGGQLDRFQRIDVISRVEGFLPATKPEQVETMALQNYPERLGGAAKHLAEVVVSKAKEGMEEPMRAARGLTRNYIGYAIDANESGKKLGVLEEEISDANPELILDRVVDIEHVGLRPFLRFYDLSVLRDEESFKSIGYDPQRINYGPENGGLIPIVMEAVASWRVHQVRKRVSEARQSEANRFIHWAGKVVEIRDHYPKLRPIAEEGLDTIYGRTKIE